MIEPNPYSTDSQTSSGRSMPRSHVLLWLRLALVCSIAHGLLVWLSIASISDRSWTMDGGGETWAQLVGQIVALVLSFPAVLICLFSPLPPLAWASPPFLIANSCLWGIALSLIWTKLKNR